MCAHVYVCVPIIFFLKMLSFSPSMILLVELPLSSTVTFHAGRTLANASQESVFLKWLNK